MFIKCLLRYPYCKVLPSFFFSFFVVYNHVFLVVTVMWKQPLFYICVILNFSKPNLQKKKPRLTSLPQPELFKTSWSVGSDVKEQQGVCLPLRLIILPLRHLSMRSLLWLFDGSLPRLLSPLCATESICISLKIESLFPPCIGSLHSSLLCNVGVPGGKEPWGNRRFSPLFSFFFTLLEWRTGNNSGHQSGRRRRLSAWLAIHKHWKRSHTSLSLTGS